MLTGPGTIAVTRQGACGIAVSARRRNPLASIDDQTGNRARGLRGTPCAAERVHGSFLESGGRTFLSGWKRQTKCLSSWTRLVNLFCYDALLRRTATTEGASSGAAARTARCRSSPAAPVVRCRPAAARVSLFAASRRRHHSASPRTRRKPRGARAADRRPGRGRGPCRWC